MVADGENNTLFRFRGVHAALELNLAERSHPSADDLVQL